MNSNNIQTKLDYMNNMIRTMMNDNNALFSQHSKNSEILSNGSCSLRIDPVKKHFIFKASNYSDLELVSPPNITQNSITISPGNNNIKNVEYLNDTIRVADLLTASDWINNDKIKEILKQYALKTEVENEYGWLNHVFENKDGVTVKRNIKANGMLNDMNVDDILTPEKLLANKDLVDKLKGNVPENLEYRLRVLEVDLHIRTNKYRIKELESYFYS